MTTATTATTVKVSAFQNLFRDEHLNVTAYATENVIGEAFGKQFGNNSAFVSMLKNCLGSLSADSFKTARNILKSLLVVDDESGENSQPLGKWHNITHNGKLVYAFYQPENVELTATVTEPEPTPEEMYEVYKKAMPAFVTENEELLGQVAVVQLIKLAWQNRKRSTKAVEEPVLYFWVAGNVVSGSGFAPVSEVMSAMPLRKFNSNVNFDAITSSFTVNPPVELHIPATRTSKESTQTTVQPDAPTQETVGGLLDKVGYKSFDIVKISPRHNEKNEVIDFAINYMADGRKLTILWSGLQAKANAKQA